MAAARDGGRLKRASVSPTDRATSRSCCGAGGEVLRDALCLSTSLVRCRVVAFSGGFTDSAEGQGARRRFVWCAELATARVVEPRVSATVLTGGLEAVAAVVGPLLGDGATQGQVKGIATPIALFRPTRDAFSRSGTERI